MVKKVKEFENNILMFMSRLKMDYNHVKSSKASVWMDSELYYCL